MKQEKPRRKSMQKREIVKGMAAMLVMSTFIYASLIYSALRRNPNENR